ncbi:macro domain-containing protein [Saccharibacillus alkalitolerans]|uniref:Macro domain-containing protein n=1 Tax=Saccharibacillus alkalitolerans TaxID=2705290 RepID=A0ABX0F617_9BACL|nr:macro domain-containing protein [Saccharibacillus alkalitolerans]NGZ76401.1 macro domain-containing protein [Saccharibacillus alkalitolerans]
MNFTEIEGDLFALPDDYVLAHCISADAKMGKGIAAEFVRRFALEPLKAKAAAAPLEVGACYREGRVMNLVTKAKYFNKPTYASLTAAVRSLRDICERESVTKLAMPRIGSGLDRLRWEKVREIVREQFAGMEIEVRVCVLPGTEKSEPQREREQT